MTTATKTFLGISAAGFIVGAIVDFGGFTVNPMWTVALPVGAIFLGVFLISLIMEKEVARYDDELAKKIALARQNTTPATEPAPRGANLSTYENKALQAVR